MTAFAQTQASVLAETRTRAASIREHVVAMATSPEGAHVGGALSAADILAVLYFHVLRVRPEHPAWPGRDWFILSKGHASAALYAALAERGFFPVSELATYARRGGRLAGHPLRRVPGVEFPTGSLGHGLSLAVGLALGAQRDDCPNRAFVLLGDGELQEGSVWEAALAAATFGLDNLVAIVDLNGLQINGPTYRHMPSDRLPEQWRSFGWEVAEVNGHEHGDLAAAFEQAPRTSGRPTVLLAHTVKGRGIRFLEGRKKSHYASFTPELYERAMISLQHPQ